MNLMEYRGYYGSADYSKEDKVFYGKIEKIRDLVSYEGDDIRELRQAFEEAVDDYLEMLYEQNAEPERRTATA